MNNWIKMRIEKAGWLRFLAWLAIDVGYSVWAFLLPGPWTRIGNAMGAEMGEVPAIPETQFGFTADQPALAFGQLGEATNDYILFQLVDVPYAIISTMMVSAAIAIGLKRFNLGASAWRFILLAPLIYLAAEIVEDPLLAAMAGGYLPMEGVIGTIQQAATTVKTSADGIASLAAAISLLATAGAALSKPFRKKSA